MGGVGSKLVSNKTGDCLTISDDDVHIMIGAATMQGWRNYQEDRYSIHLYHHPRGEDDPVTFTLVASLFDGHGGSNTAEACKRLWGPFMMSRLHPELADEFDPSSEPDPMTKSDLLFTEKTIKETFIRFDMSVLRAKTHHACGATATVVVLNTRLRKLVVAHAGDSRAMAFTPLRAPMYISNDHSPCDPIEIARIVRAGLKIQNGRVLFRDVSSLNLCRSFGDKNYKGNTTLPPAEQAVTADPDVWRLSYDFDGEPSTDDRPGDKDDEQAHPLPEPCTRCLCRAPVRRRARRTALTFPCSSVHAFNRPAAPLCVQTTARETSLRFHALDGALVDGAVTGCVCACHAGSPAPSQSPSVDVDAEEAATGLEESKENEEGKASSTSTAAEHDQEPRTVTVTRAAGPGDFPPAEGAAAVALVDEEEDEAIKPPHQPQAVAAEDGTEADKPAEPPATGEDDSESKARVVLSPSMTPSPALAPAPAEPDSSANKAEAEASPATAPGLGLRKHRSVLVEAGRAEDVQAQLQLLQAAAEPDCISDSATPAGDAAPVPAPDQDQDQDQDQQPVVSNTTETATGTELSSTPASVTVQTDADAGAAATSTDAPSTPRLLKASSSDSTLPVTPTEKQDQDQDESPAPNALTRSNTMQLSPSAVQPDAEAPNTAAEAEAEAEAGAGAGAEAEAEAEAEAGGSVADELARPLCSRDLVLVLASDGIWNGKYPHNSFPDCVPNDLNAQVQHQLESMLASPAVLQYLQALAAYYHRYVAEPFARFMCPRPAADGIKPAGIPAKLQRSVAPLTMGEADLAALQLWHCHAAQWFTEHVAPQLMQLQPRYRRDRDTQAFVSTAASPPASVSPHRVIVRRDVDLPAETENNFRKLMPAVFGPFFRFLPCLLHRPLTDEPEHALQPFVFRTPGDTTQLPVYQGIPSMPAPAPSQQQLETMFDVRHFFPSLARQRLPNALPLVASQAIEQLVVQGDKQHPNSGSTDNMTAMFIVVRHRDRHAHSQTRAAPAAPTAGLSECSARDALRLLVPGQELLGRPPARYAGDPQLELRVPPPGARYSAEVVEKGKSQAAASSTPAPAREEVHSSSRRRSSATSAASASASRRQSHGESGRKRARAETSSEQTDQGNDEAPQRKRARSP